MLALIMCDNLTSPAWDFFTIFNWLLDEHMLKGSISVHLMKWVENNPVWKPWIIEKSLGFILYINLLVVMDACVQYFGASPQMKLWVGVTFTWVTKV